MKVSSLRRIGLAVAGLVLSSTASVVEGKKGKCSGHFGGSVANLCESHFPDKKSDKVWFVKFYAPWCGHCQAMIPAWKQLGKHFKGDEVIGIGGVDCDANENKGLCGRMGVQGFPTLKAIVNGKPKAYNGAREFEPLKQYAEQLKKKRGNKGGSAKCAKGIFKSTIKDSVVPLCGKHFPDPAKGGKHSWVVSFYNKSSYPESDKFNRLALEFGNEPQDKNKGSRQDKKQKKRVEEISEKYGIKAKIDDGSLVQKRKGSGSKDPLAKFGAVCCDCDKDSKDFCASEKIPGMPDGALPNGVKGLADGKPVYMVYNAVGKRTAVFASDHVGEKFDEDEFATFMMEKLGFVAGGSKKDDSKKDEL